MLEAFELFKSSSINLTLETVCKLHKTMMRRSRVLCANKGYARRLEYVNIGVTRQVTASNVTVTVRATGMKVQFCPWDEINAELAVFCDRFNVSIVAFDMVRTSSLPSRRYFAKTISIPSQLQPGSVMYLLLYIHLRYVCTVLSGSVPALRKHFRTAMDACPAFWRPCL